MTSIIMQQSSGGDPASGRRPSISNKYKQPVGILRRSSTTDINKSYKLDRSTRYDHDANERSKRNGYFNNYQHSPAVITDVDELANRLLKYKHSYEPSALSSAGNNYVQPNHSYTPMSRNRRHRTPPPSPQTVSISSRKQRSRSEVMSTSSSKGFDQVQQHRRSPTKSWSNATEEEYVRRMSAVKLDQSDRSVRGGASSSEYRSEMHDREVHESFNSSYSSPSKRYASSSPSSDHPKLPFFPKSPSASSKSSLRNSATRSRSRGRGRSKSSDRVPIDPPFDEYQNAQSPRNGRQQTRSGGDDIPVFVSPKNPSESPTMSRRSSSRSRVRGRSRSKSASRKLFNQNREEDENFSMSTDEMGIRRAKSSEQLHHLHNSTERQRRARTRSPHNSKGSNVDDSSGREKIWTKAFGNFREKFLSHSNHASSSKSLSQETSSRRRHRSRSRDERRSSEKEESNDDGMSLGKGQKALDKAKRGRSRDRASKMSESYDGRSNLGSNSFVHESTKVKFDKKTGRCKKHPSIVMAKKSAFRSGSWEVVRKCPFCSESKDDPEHKFDEDTKGRMDNLLKDGQDFNGDASMSQFSKKSEAKTRGNNRKGNSTPSKQNVIDAIPEGLREKNASVSRMLYTTPMGEPGWYTGEVDSDEQPHGYGRMRYKTGNSYEGEWIHGYAENHSENLSRMKLKSGFGSNKATRRKSETNRNMGASSRLHRRG